MKVGWRGALGILLSALLLWWTLRGVDLRDVWRVLSNSSIGLWAACTVAATAIFPLRARRWEALLVPIAGRLSFSPLWQSTAVGMMMNNVVPARAGEFARAFALSRAEPRVKFTAAFASLAVDRLFDGAVVLLLMIVAMLDPAFAAHSANGNATLLLSMRWSALFLALVLAVLVFIVFAPQRVYAVYDAVMGRVAPRLAPKGRHLL